MTRPAATAPRRPRRLSCRVGCTLAALLATVGGLRWLAAAEGPPGHHPAAPAAARAAAPGTVAEAFRPYEAPAALEEATAADLERTVASRTEGIGCTTGGCGFARLASPFTTAAREPFRRAAVEGGRVSWARLAGAPPTPPRLEAWSATAPARTAPRF